MRSDDEKFMSRQIPRLLLALVALAAWPHSAADAQDIPTLPQPRLAGPLPATEDDTPHLPLAEIRQFLQKLKREREGLDNDRTKAIQLAQDSATTESDEIAKLRLQLGNLLNALNTKKSAPGLSATPLPAAPKKLELPIAPNMESPRPQTQGQPQVQPLPPVGPEPAPPTFEVGGALDPLALAQALFRVGNYPGALKAYRLMPLEGLKADERAPVQYMIATCLRKLGNTDEAAVLYREVANSRGDEQLAACAQWQLNALRWRKDMNEQLARIRQRRLDLEKQP